MLTYPRRKTSTLVKILYTKFQPDEIGKEGPIGLPNAGLIINRLSTRAALPGANLITDYK